MHTETNTGVVGPENEIEELQKGLEEAERRLKEESHERAVAAKALASLARPEVLQSPKKLQGQLQAAKQKLTPEMRECLGIAQTWAQLEQYQQQAPLILRRSVGRALKQRCEREGLELYIVSKEAPVEVRIPPLSVEMDFTAGRANLGFARSPLATCELSAERILQTYDTLVKELEGAFDPREFFALCHRAYQLILIESRGHDGDRVELVRVLPFLAMLKQSAQFQRNPTREAFRSYTRAHFAYDVLRLRRQGGLIQEGLRLNLGVATGISASQKGRAIYFEDEQGHGEFKLTLYFTRSPAGGSDD
jgi:hypothetical protein